MGAVGRDIMENGVARIVLDDPAGRNPLDQAAREAIAGHLGALCADPSVRAIVIGAEGRNFSVGGDLSQIAGHVAGQPAYQMMRSVNELALLVDASSKPIVAAVGGHCIGAGAGLALLCDQIVVGRSAAIAFPFLKVGLVADFGVTFSLPRRIGLVQARKALIEARSFSADEALATGLADAIAEDEDVWTIAIDRALALAAAPAAALMQIRQMLRDAPPTLSAALEAEALHQALCFGSSDLQEGLAAFKDKRRPDFVRTAR